MWKCCCTGYYDPIDQECNSQRLFVFRERLRVVQSHHEAKTHLQIEESGETREFIKLSKKLTSFKDQNVPKLLEPLLQCSLTAKIARHARLTIRQQMSNRQISRCPPHGRLWLQIRCRAGNSTIVLVPMPVLGTIVRSRIGWVSQC